MEIYIKFFEKNGLVVAFLVTGLIMLLSNFVSKKLLNKKIPGSAIAISAGLVLAYFGGAITNGSKGIADLPFLSGFKEFGGSVFRDFAITSTAVGASLALMKKAGKAGGISLLVGTTLSFLIGVVIAIAFGFRDAESLTTIGAGAITFIVGPVTGTAVQASSDVIALSIGAGVVKSVFVTIGTPLLAKRVGLDNPLSAMIFGGLMGTTSGVAAGLAATDPKLVPYGAVTATFCTGLGCLLCPSVFYLIVGWMF
jgi:malonate transporter MadM subunit